MGLVTGLALGAAALGAGASAISSNKASKRAARTSQDTTASNNALARDIYGQNRQTLSPFVNRGNVAGNQINALLGLGGSQQMGGPAAMPQPNAMSQFGGYSPTGNVGGSPVNLGGVNWGPSDGRYTMGYGDWVNQNMGYADAGMPYGLGDGFVSTGTMDGGMINAANNTMGQMPTQTGQTATQAQNAAFDNFRNSTGYQFRLGEGLDAVGSTYAGIGGLQSGAAMRGITDYGQNFASNEFGNYINALGNQQAVGAGGASALAGVGQNYAGTVIGSNNLNAQNQMNAQLSRQNPLANMLGTVGGGFLGMGR
jgi:hypothetical protein